MFEEPEQEVVADYLSWSVRAPFEVAEVPESRSEVKQNAKWFVWCPDTAYAKEVCHIKYVWKSHDNYVWLETSEIGDTIGLVEREYGEEGAKDLMKMDLSNFTKRDVLLSFNSRFPLIAKRFDEWARILRRISRQHEIHLELRFDGTRNIAIYTIGAKIEWEKNGLGKMKLAIGALKEAYGLVFESDQP